MAGASPLIRATECDAGVVRRFFATVPPAKVQIEQHDDLDSILRRGQCFMVLDDGGDAIGAYVLQALGGELWILAAAGRAEIDLTAVMLALIEWQAQDFDSIGFQTRRRGLEKKAQRHGYRIARQTDNAVIMRKTLK